MSPPFRLFLVICLPSRRKAICLFFPDYCYYMLLLALQRQSIMGSPVFLSYFFVAVLLNDPNNKWQPVVLAKV